MRRLQQKRISRVFQRNETQKVDDDETLQGEGKKGEPFELFHSFTPLGGNELNCFACRVEKSACPRQVKSETLCMITLFLPCNKPYGIVAFCTVDTLAMCAACFLL